MKLRFNKPITLTHIRKSVGFTLSEVSEKLNISENELRQIEISKKFECSDCLIFEELYGVDIFKILDTNRLLENLQIYRSIHVNRSI